MSDRTAQGGDRPRTPDNKSTKSRSQHAHHEPSSLTLSYTDLPGMRDSFEADEQIHTLIDIGGGKERSTKQTDTKTDNQLNALRERAFAKLDAAPDETKQRGSIIKSSNKELTKEIEDVIVAKNGDVYYGTPNRLLAGRKELPISSDTFDSSIRDPLLISEVTEKSITTRDKIHNGRVLFEKKAVTCKRCSSPNSDLTGQIEKFNCEDRQSTTRCGCTQRVQFSDNSRPVTPNNDELEREDRPNLARPACADDESIINISCKENCDCTICNHGSQTERVGECPVKEETGCPNVKDENTETTGWGKLVNNPLEKIAAQAKHRKTAEESLQTLDYSKTKRIGKTVEVSAKVKEEKVHGKPVQLKTEKSVTISAAKQEPAEPKADEKDAVAKKEKSASKKKNKSKDKKKSKSKTKKEKSKSKSKKEKSKSKSKKTKSTDKEEPADIATSPSTTKEASKSKKKKKKKKDGDNPEKVPDDPDDEEVPPKTFCGIRFGKAKKRHKSISTEAKAETADETADPAKLTASSEDPSGGQKDECLSTEPDFPFKDDFEQCSPQTIMEDIEKARKTRNKELKHAMKCDVSGFPSTAAGWMSDEECSKPEVAVDCIKTEKLIAKKCDTSIVPDDLLLLTDGFLNDKLCSCEVRKEKRKTGKCSKEKERNDKSYSSLGFTASKCQKVMEPSFKSVGCGDLSVMNAAEKLPIEKCVTSKKKRVACGTENDSFEGTSRTTSEKQKTARFLESYDTTHCNDKSQLVATILSSLHRMEQREHQSPGVQTETKHLTAAGQCLYQTKKELEKRVKNLGKRLDSLQCKKSDLTSQCDPSTMTKICQKAACLKKKLERELRAEHESYEAAKRCLHRTTEMYDNLVCNIQSQWCQEYTQLKGENAVLDAEFYRTQAALREAESEIQRLCYSTAQTSDASCMSPMEKVNCALAAVQPSTRKLLEEAKSDRLTHFEQLLDIRFRYQTAVQSKICKMEQYYESFKQQCNGLFKGVYYILHQACPSDPVLMQPAVCRFVLSAKCMDVCMVRDNLREEIEKNESLTQRLEALNCGRERMVGRLTEMAANCGTAGRSALLPKMQNRQGVVCE